MALETSIMIKLFGSAAVLCSRLLLDRPLDEQTVAIAECLPAFVERNTELETRLAAHTKAMSGQLAESGYADKAEQLTAAAGDVLKAGLTANFRNTLKRTGLNGKAIWDALSVLPEVKKRLSPENTDSPVRDLIPVLMMGLFDAWANDPKTLEDLRAFQFNLIIELGKTGENTNQRARDLQTKVEELINMVSSLGGTTTAQEVRHSGLSDAQLLSLVYAFEAANEPKVLWFDLLIEKAALLKDLRARLTGLSNIDPTVSKLRRQAESAIEKAGFAEAERLLETAEVLDSGAVAVIERDLEERQQNLVQRKESQAASAFARGELAEAQLRYAQAYEHHLRAYRLVPEKIEYLRKAQDFAERNGDYKSAIQLAERLCENLSKSQGTHSSQYADALNELAIALVEDNRFDDAEPLYNQAIQICETALEPGNAYLATPLNNLAWLHHHQGRYKEAEPLYRRAIAISETAHGPNHHEVATALNNLAGLHQVQGMYADAEALYQRAIKIGGKTLGPNHPTVATWLNNLAKLHTELGQYDEAEPLYVRAIDAFERAFPNGHPYLDRMRNNEKLMKTERNKRN